MKNAVQPQAVLSLSLSFGSFLPSILRMICFYLPKFLVNSLLFKGFITGWHSAAFFGFSFLKMEGRPTYLYHYLENIEEKILEGAEESGELPEKHLWASKRRWDSEELTLAWSMDSPRTVPDGKQWRSIDVVEAVSPLWLSQFCQSNRKQGPLKVKMGKVCWSKRTDKKV